MRKPILTLTMILFFLLSSTAYGGEKAISGAYYARTGDKDIYFSNQ